MWKLYWWFNRGWEGTQEYIYLWGRLVKELLAVNVWRFQGNTECIEDREDMQGI